MSLLVYAERTAEQQLGADGPQEVDGVDRAEHEERGHARQRATHLTPPQRAGQDRDDDRGRIDLDAPIQTYVPSYPQKQWTISTRQLLGDVAGVHRPRGDSNDNLAYGHCTSLDEALKAFAGEPLSFEPGTQYQFSTYG